MWCFGTFEAGNRAMDIHCYRCKIYYECCKETDRKKSKETESRKAKRRE